MAVIYDKYGQGISVKDSTALNTVVSPQFRTLPETTSVGTSRGSTSPQAPKTSGSSSAVSSGGGSAGTGSMTINPFEVMSSFPKEVGRSIGGFVQGVINPYREEDIAREQKRYEEERSDAKIIQELQNQIALQEQARREAELQLERQKAADDRYFKELAERNAMQRWFDQDAAAKREEQQAIAQAKIQNDQFYAMLKAQTLQAKERNDLAIQQLEYQREAIIGGYVVPKGYYDTDYSTPPDVLGNTVLDLLEQNALSYSKPYSYSKKKQTFKYSYGQKYYKEKDSYGIHSKSTSGYSY